jgi:hypothetical protein
MPVDLSLKYKSDSNRYNISGALGIMSLRLLLSLAVDDLVNYP